MTRVVSRHVLVLVVCIAFGVTLGVLQGCEVDLGSCDEAQAKTLYYLDGVPYYEGQAIVQQSCAGSFCHAAGARKSARIGAPHELNFDVSPLLDSSSDHDVSVLQQGIALIREEAGELYSVVDDGEMPPGDAGKRPALAWMTHTVAGGLAAAMLPSVKSKAGKDALRNWLACDAPIVAYTTGAPGQEKKLGDVVAKQEAKVDPTFDSIYGAVLGGICASCHNPDSANPFKAEQNLDFTSAETAYTGLVGQDPFVDGMCDGHGKLVVAGDCQGSLLYQKLLPEAEQPTDFCGEAMPLASPPVSQAVLDAVCMWIDAGAER